MVDWKRVSVPHGMDMDNVKIVLNLNGEAVKLMSIHFLREIEKSKIIKWCHFAACSPKSGR